MAITRRQGAYIIGARRTALGRVGGLHATRRLEDLAAPVIAAVCGDAGIKIATVDTVIVGNATAGANPARLIALAAGVPETAAAITIDQQDASGLVAIVDAVRLVCNGDADVVIAGGAESLSTAPWRVARPRNMHQTPHFISPEPMFDGAERSPLPIAATERMAKGFNISRAQQDMWAAQSVARAVAAREETWAAGEIVALRRKPEEARDQIMHDADLDEFENAEPFTDDSGTLTPANTSSWYDGAAFVVVVSEAVWQALGQPPGLRLVENASLGVSPQDEAIAPMRAVEKLYSRLNGFDRSTISVLETSETSAAQVIAMAEGLGLDLGSINPGGGAVARGHPFSAAGAVLVVRLFSQLVRRKEVSEQAHGVAVQGAVGGMGVAALFGRTTVSSGD